MTIQQAWKKGIGYEGKKLSYRPTFDINFINADGEADETQFTSSSNGWRQIPYELTELFTQFCKENNHPTDTVTSITWVDDN